MQLPMNSHQPDGHTLKRYDKDMRKLQQRVLSMGDMVHQQMNRLQQALSSVTEDTVLEIMEAEDAIDRQEIKVDKYIIKILARRSPVGSDLRFIVASSRIVTDLERLGDEAAQMTKTLLDENWSLADCENLSAHGEVTAMLSLLTQLFDSSIQAFESFDYKAAKEIAFGSAGTNGELQGRMDYLAECSRTVKEEDVLNAVNLALFMRSMERGLRYVQNISEHVVYLLTATDIRHQRLHENV